MRAVDRYVFSMIMKAGLEFIEWFDSVVETAQCCYFANQPGQVEGRGVNATQPQDKQMVPS